MSKEEAAQELNELRENIKFMRWWVENGQVDYINNMSTTKALLVNINTSIDECTDPDRRLKLYERRNGLAESYGLLLQNYSRMMDMQKQMEKQLPELEKMLE